jgi:hypothetical protein
LIDAHKLHRAFLGHDIVVDPNHHCLVPLDAALILVGAALDLVLNIALLDGP